MGLDINGIRLMLYAKKLGIDFDNVVTIGRQGLHVSPTQLSRQLSQFGMGKHSVDAPLNDTAYCEPFFTLLGASDTQSIDNSDYENATIIHDMNQSLPEQLKSRLSVVVDAGTLEHVFNYPVAIKNCMELLQTGGVFISFTPANNFMGHGFYQFSPELFFSVFTPNNGFELVKLLVCEDYEDAPWYEVDKPKGGIQGRVTLINHRPTYLMCIARRLDEKCEPFIITPQQSDYIETWGQTSLKDYKFNSSDHKESSLISLVKRLLKSVPGMKTLARNICYFRKPTFPNRDYTPFNPLH